MKPQHSTGRRACELVQDLHFPAPGVIVDDGSDGERFGVIIGVIFDFDLL
jgi:hypothetical protein